MSLANFSRWTGVSSLGKKSCTSSADPNSSVSSFTPNDLPKPREDAPNDFGTLIVVVMKARNLYNRRAISKQNPYCSVRIAKHSDRTKTIVRGGQAPVWDHETRFRLSCDDDNSNLKLCVFDQNGSNTEIIGDAQIPLHAAYRSSVQDGYDSWFPIHYNKRYVGEVYLEMTFYPKKKRESRRSSATSSLKSSRDSRSRSTSPVRQLPSTSSSYSNLHSNLNNQSSFYAHNPSSTSQLQGKPQLGPLDTHSGRRYGSPTGSPTGTSLGSSQYMKHSESMPSLRPHSPNSRRQANRPLPQIPQTPPVPLHPTPPTMRHPPVVPSSQEDILGLINHGYEESLLEQLKPSASQPYM